jgi:predicted CopG family antitoxin
MSEAVKTIQVSEATWERLERIREASEDMSFSEIIDAILNYYDYRRY